MPQFKIEMELTSVNERILLTDFDSAASKFDGLTFNENLTESENSQYNLSFQLMGKSGRSREIPIGKLVSIGRPIWLHTTNPERSIRMVITSYSPVIGSENLTYNIECQDYASYAFSRNNVGLSLDTISDDDFIDWLQLIFDTDIPEVESITKYILERGWLRKRSGSTPDWNYDGWDVNIIGDDKQLNLELSDSNTYNALIELANLANMEIRFDYVNSIITFIDKESATLDKNYTLKRDFNLQDMSLTYNGDNMYSIMYIDGAEDELGFQTLLSDETLYKDNFLYDFNYFQDRGLLTEAEYLDITNKLNVDLLELNKNLRQVTTERYTQLGLINNTWSRINNLAEILAAPTQFQDYIQTFLDFNAEFYRPSIGTPVNVTVAEDFVVLNILWNDLPSSLVASVNGTVQYPIVFNYWGKQYKVTDANPITLTQGVQIEIRLTSASGFTAYPNTSAWYKFFYRATNATNANFDIRRLNVVSVAARFQISRIDQGVPYIRPFFDLLYQYNGTAEINKYYNNVLDIITDFTSQKAQDQQEKQCIIDYGTIDYNPTICDPFGIPEDPNVRLARLLYLEQTIADYVNVIGEIISINGGEYVGKYSLIRDTFIKYQYNLYNPSPSTSKIMDRYWAAILAKQNFWYDLKSTRQHLFVEGYYENQVETNGASLLEQAEVIYQDHNKPLEDFSISYIDISDIIGLDIENISSGDFITLNENMLEIQNTPTSKLKVASVSRNLRDKANISLEIYRYSLINNILEKIVANNKK